MEKQSLAYPKAKCILLISFFDILWKQKHGCHPPHFKAYNLNKDGRGKRKTHSPIKMVSCYLLVWASNQEVTEQPEVSPGEEGACPVPSISNSDIFFPGRSKFLAS